MTDSGSSSFRQTNVSSSESFITNDPNAFEKYKSK